MPFVSFKQHTVRVVWSTLVFICCFLFAGTNFFFTKGRAALQVPDARQWKRSSHPASRLLNYSISSIICVRSYGKYVQFEKNGANIAPSINPGKCHFELRTSN